MNTDVYSSNPEQCAPSALPRTQPANNRWIGWSFLAGLAVAVPSGWLLAYLAALPFLLGLFFFLLLGLVIGATMYRVGSQSPVPAKGTLWLLGSSVAVILVLTSLYTEYRALPRSVEKRVRDSISDPLSPDERAHLRQGVRQFVATQIDTNYPPGGFLGYLRWAATSGKFTCPRILRESTVELRLSHRRILWIVRVGLSLLMVEWTVMSQVVGLRLPAPAGESERALEADPPENVT